jgi:hypothetical protein
LYVWQGKELARLNVEMLENWERVPTPRGFCMDVKQKDLRKKGFVRI